MTDHNFQTFLQKYIYQGACKTCYHLNFYSSPLNADSTDFLIPFTDFITAGSIKEMRGLWSGWINIQNQYEDINNISTTNISFDHFDYLIISIILVFDLEFGSKLKSVFQKHRQFPWYERGLEAVVKTCSVKKVFIEILQNSQENTCARVFF